MKSPEALGAEASVKSSANESAYTEVQYSISQALKRGLELRLAVDSLELKVLRAVAEFEIELDSIKRNYDLNTP